ncbi:hypothetical protein ACWCQK_39340 [Streptomyces sp. NPDC002306]
MNQILRETAPQYFAGLLVLATAAAVGALVRFARRRRVAARRQAAQSRRPEENL